MPGRKLGVLFLLGGILIEILAWWGLRCDVAWIAQPFYAWAWWGYIFALDGYCLLRRGHSLLTRSPSRLTVLLAGSVTFWFFFELLNFRFQNWYYVGVFRAETMAGALKILPFPILCFATVFVGIFETDEALKAARLWESWRGTKRRLSRRAVARVQLVGVGMALLAIAFPYYLAPLIWGSFTLIVDPFNHRTGARSLLADLEARDFGRLARLLLAGLICGVVWESLNYFAPQKWIYTVRGLEGLKLFEMPLLGFLGFPLLALDSVAGASLIYRFFFGGGTWEAPGDSDVPPARKAVGTARMRALAWPAQLAFWAGMSLFFVRGHSIGSVELRLDDLPALADANRTALAEIGVLRPRHLLLAARDPTMRARLRQVLGGDDARLEETLRQADLYTFKGIGASYGRLLEAAGVASVNDLKAWTAEDLHRHLVESAAGYVRVPREDMVRVWVLGSRSRRLLQTAAS